MNRLLRPRFALACGGLVLAFVMAAWVVPPRLEHAVRDRLEREATRRGLVAHVQEVDVSLWPPLTLRDLRLERPGEWALAVSSVEVMLRIRGSGLLGRTSLALGGVTLRMPDDLALEVAPTLWDVVGVARDGFRAELRRPAGDLALSWLPFADGGRLEVRALGVPAGRLISVRRAGVPLLDAGTLEGSLQVGRSNRETTFELDARVRAARLPALSSGEAFESAAPGFGLPIDATVRLEGTWLPAEGALDLRRWRVATETADLAGTLTLAELPSDPRLTLSLEVERLDFVRLLGALGLDQPEVVATPVSRTAPAGELGSASLSASASGRLADPASFVVSQRIEFTPPRRPLPALERLRGDFVHEAVSATGTRKAIAVSPLSPEFIALRDVPPLFVRTLLLAEDSGFFGHRGIDLSELPAAILTNLSRGRPTRGASTITQQLAKNLFLSRDKRLGRKLQELSLALLLEATLSKERILEIYVNVIEWGPDLHGLRPAARHYFAKEPQELTPAQMAFLVALIPGPLKYQHSFADGTPSPGFRQLMDNLLAKLRSVDALTEEEYRAALGEDAVVGLENSGEAGG